MIIFPHNIKVMPCPCPLLPNLPHTIKLLKIPALEANQTWQIVEKLPRVKPIGRKWVYKIMRKLDGSIERYKARLVAKKYTQTKGVNFFDAFSPVVKVTNVWLLLIPTSTKNWLIHQLDVNNVFLYGELEEDVYMEMPKGVNCNEKNKACKFLKSLYGLKQVTQMSVDHIFFALLIYVDDIVLVRNSHDEIVYIKSTFDQYFSIKHLRVLKYFLRLEVTHTSKGISLCQRHSCLDILANA
ncbi:hypothetical protein CR513_29600, partial [Mucuna pruriens]